MGREGMNTGWSDTEQPADPEDAAHCKMFLTSHICLLNEAQVNLFRRQ